jgi:hypothetical protein
MIITGDILRKFVARYPFTKVKSRYFNASPSTAKEVLSRELGFRKYARLRSEKSSAIELLEFLRGGKPLILMGLQLVMSHVFIIIMNRAKYLQRREKK